MDKSSIDLAKCVCKAQKSLSGCLSVFDAEFHSGMHIKMMGTKWWLWLKFFRYFLEKTKFYGYESWNKAT